MHLINGFSRASSGFDSDPPNRVGPGLGVAIDDVFENKLEEEASLETKYKIGKYLLDNLEKLGSFDILDW